SPALRAGVACEASSYKGAGNPVYSGQLPELALKLPQIRRRDIPDLPRFEGLPPLLARILAGRGITSLDEVPLTLEHLPAPALLHGLEQAVALLREAKRNHWRILVIGDYDA